MERHMIKTLSVKLILMLCACCCFAECAGEEQKKIALLFLTRADLNHSQLWQEWIEERPGDFSVYNHCKTPPSDPWFSQFAIPEKCETDWAYTMMAQQALLREALKDPCNYKFVFLSESCVPLRSHAEVYKILTRNDYSYIKWRSIWWACLSYRVLHEFPSEHHWGNQQWIILNRKHAQIIADDDHWIKLASKHVADNEAYPATYLSMKGVLHEAVNVLTTYVDWSRSNGFSPYTFEEATQENIDLLLKVKINRRGEFEPMFCLFGRKFSSKFPDEEIKRIMNSSGLDIEEDTCQN